MGVSRQHYYDMKERFSLNGYEGLKDKPRKIPDMPNKAPLQREKTVIDYSLEHPTFGKDRVSIQLRFDGLFISPTGVEKIWRRHGLENRFKRLLRLEALSFENGLILSEEQIQALMENANRVPAEHVFSSHPGYLLCQDTFEVGCLKGVGRVYMQSVIDTYGSFGFGKLYTSKLPTTCADILVDKVIPFYQSLGIPIRRILTDNGGEFCGRPMEHDYELILQIFDIQHRRIRAGVPQTNGFVERFNRTCLEEFFCVAFRKKWYHSVEELQADLDTYLWHYNFQRHHQGYRVKNKRPIDVLLDSSVYPKLLTEDHGKKEMGFINRQEEVEVSTQLEA